MSRLRDDLGLWLGSLGFEPEVRFRGRSGKRRFRFDWAKAGEMLAVEYDGMGVGHQSISGTWADAEKGNEAVLCGWRIIRCNAKTTREGGCHEMIEAALRGGDG
ncbi:MAG: hypothetical protein M3Q74_13220 [Pseudomonadota bacterium]|nr:hypothetical protein [Pseudomonadota bacterium]